MAKGDGRDGKRLTMLAKTDVLMLDDWGLAPFSEENRRDLLEIVEDRHDRRATILTRQLPVEHWHDALGDPTLADAILDRLVGLDHGVGHFRPLSITQQRHLMAYHGIAMSSEGLCQVL